MLQRDGMLWYNLGMSSNHKPCPKCGNPMHRQSPMCRACSRSDPKYRAKISAVRTGKPSYQRTHEQRLAMSIRTTGIRHSWKSASTQPEVADRIRQAWTPDRREAARQRGLQMAQDREWRLRCGRPGELSPTWEDGRAVLPYARGWTKRWKEQAWERAGYRCEICQSDKPRDTHHIDFRKDNHHLSNLQVLCRLCHKRLHAENRRKSPQD